MPNCASVLNSLCLSYLKAGGRANDRTLAARRRAMRPNVASLGLSSINGKLDDVDGDEGDAVLLSHGTGLPVANLGELLGTGNPAKTRFGLTSFGELMASRHNGVFTSQLN